VRGAWKGRRAFRRPLSGEREFIFISGAISLKLKDKEEKKTQE